MQDSQILKMARQALNVSQAAIAKSAEVPRRSLDRHERGQGTLSAPDFFAVIRALRAAFYESPITDSDVIAFLADPGGLGEFKRPPHGNGPGGNQGPGNPGGEQNGNERISAAVAKDAQASGLNTEASGGAIRDGSSDIREHGKPALDSKARNIDESAERLERGNEAITSSAPQTQIVVNGNGQNRMLSNSNEALGAREISRAPASGNALSLAHWLKEFSLKIGNQSEELNTFLRREDKPEKVMETIHSALFGYNLIRFDRHDFARRYTSCKDMPGQQLARRILIQISALKGFLGRIPSNPAEWTKAFNKARQYVPRFHDGAISERKKPKDVEREKSWSALWSVLGPMIVISQQCGPRDDVKDEFKKTSYRKSLVIHIFRQEVLRQKCQRAWSEASQKEIPFPSLNLILGKLHEHYGPVNRFLEMKQHVREMVSQKVERYAQLWAYDASTVDVEVGHSWHQKSNGRKQRFIYSRVDCYSGELASVALSSGNEHAAWHEGANRLVDECDIAPEELLTDKGGKLVGGFAALKPGMTYEEITQHVAEGILTLVAAGSKPSHHTPGRPQGKAFCERGIGLHKDDFHAMLDARAMALQVEGKLPAKCRRRYYPSEPAFQNAYSEAIAYRNNECENFRKTGMTRAELAAESKSKTELIRMKPNARMLLKENAKKVRVLNAIGQELYDANARHCASLDTPLSKDDIAAPDSIIVILPGLQAGDSDDCVRCLCVRNRSGNNGLPHFTLYKGTRAMRDHAGFPSNAVLRGEFKTRPESEYEKQLSLRDEERKAFEAQLPAPQVAAAAAAPKKPTAPMVTLGTAPKEETAEETIQRIMNRKRA